MPDRDTDSGQYKETYPLKAFIDALLVLDEEVGTKDVEEEVGCEYRTAYGKLHELEDMGLVSERRIGNAHLWSLSKDGEASTTENEGNDGWEEGIYDPTEESP